MSASRLFTENSLIGTLEAADFESVNHVCSHLGTICEMLCGNYEVAKVTQFFTDYVDPLHFIYWSKLRARRTDEDLTIFCNMIKNFSSYTKAALGRH